MAKRESKSADERLAALQVRATLSAAPGSTRPWRRATLTVHPSSILRAPDPTAPKQARRDFVADLRKIAKRLRDK